MRVTAHIDLSALTHNLHVVKQKTSQARVVAMIKANAYGHGLLLCAKALSEVDYIGVATLEEAEALRKIAIKQPIVVMTGFQDKQDLALIQDLALETILYDERQLALLERYQGHHKIKVWLKIDTGMHRLGCPMTQAEAFLRRLEALPQVEIVAVMSHLACADMKDHPHTLRQLENFDRVTCDWSYPRSLLNSAGILYYPEFQYDIVRPGLMLYGASPNELTPQEIGVKAVMELAATILALVQVPRGEGTGYGQEWIAERDSVIAIISAGYGDGYPQYPRNAVVLIQDQICPVVGRVSMDSLAVDVTDLTTVELGENVLLWGKDLRVNEIAERAGVSVYRLLTDVMERVNRRMIL